MGRRVFSLLLVLALCLMPLATAYASGHDYQGLSGVHIQRRGSRGSEVRRLQQRLSNLGYLNARVDGSYGAKTEAAVRDFQRKNGITVSGVATLLTQAVLYGSDALNAWNNTNRAGTGTGNYDIYNADVRSWGSGLDVSFDFVNRDSHNVEAICIYYWLADSRNNVVTQSHAEYWMQWYYNMNVPYGSQASVAYSIPVANSAWRKIDTVRCIVGEIAYTDGTVVVTMNTSREPYGNRNYILSYNN